MRRQARDLTRVVALSAGVSVAAYAALQVLATVVPPFDSSAALSGAREPGLRWDALHFMAIASNGYNYEQQLAFQPGWQAVLALLPESVDARLRAAAAVNVVCRAIATASLYSLTTELFSRRAAVLSCVLYALPPSPAVITVPYTEVPFAALTFTAMFASVRRRYLLATLLFAAATSIRATGVFGAIVLAGHMMLARVGKEPFWRTIARLPAAAVASAVVAAPFVLFQAYSYAAFCDPPSRPWCLRTLPLAYSFVQREYWDVGPFRYWTFQQLPNFALAAPVLVVSGAGLWQYFRRFPRLSRPEFPIYVYQLVMFVLLLFASHVQIALRLAVTDPTLWWTLAASKRLSAWTYFCVVYGAVSLVLWAGFYPPA